MDKDIPLVQWTDRQLACETQAGCTDAFNELVRRHGGRLLRFISVRIGDKHEAEDLLQETFVRAYERIVQYDQKWSFSTWIYTIASRIMSGHYRREGMVTAGDLPFSREGGENPSDVLIRREEGRSLWLLARNSLSEEQYSAIFLRYGEGMSIREISHVLNRKPGHVKVILFRSREKLRGELKESEFVQASSVRTVQEPEIGKGDRKCSASIIEI